MEQQETVVVSQRGSEIVVDRVWERRSVSFSAGGLTGEYWTSTVQSPSPIFAPSPEHLFLADCPGNDRECRACAQACVQCPSPASSGVSR